MSFPKEIPYLIIGAGVHGLSTAWHLAKELKARNLGSGEDIIVVDKSSIASGASGIACGVVRNFYYQPAMGEVMRVSVEVWESDPEAFHYHPVGYLAVAPEMQAADVEAIYERHRRSGYRALWAAIDSSLWAMRRGSGESFGSPFRRQVAHSWRRSDSRFLR